MNKEDLKEGVKVTLRNGQQGYVLGDYILFMDMTIPFNNKYKDELKYKNVNDYDIMIIYNSQTEEVILRNDFKKFDFVISIDSEEDLIDMSRILSQGRKTTLTPKSFNIKLKAAIEEMVNANT